ncbi:MAG: transcription termination factor NusA [Candidatus Wildermuthbacteria bacterium RIFCSPHIGHO2_01_FULL_48_25]|uniref:Transcription termination/antitermination protein NusA n=1 Tax=Candidatus Wildermuthbacteria bacterium RIFCSPLOWO2_01_FULL_48_16 TaxID=1802461 RepID=A0A1G2RK06_9BACT|nr:MAG: transcription termination factor NusA [Candidatus Wildermuthbacteria bacterium RIFCSPHIGHO2_01_FULL_48_25]OHA68227.1 MAG: transcription termination factor NusA [Candidatus Wildermuthbacteria bacterium RIFCSPHIGHO2_02_FULL_49_12b]OHA73107.1 MAG: transcription termination factor NusA [Candidatus Wildermuthbacteria bacterium RIFCSPLOWO2_01_FULL_48_16]
MIDLKNLALLVDHISSEKGLAKEVVFDMVEQALASAYKKEYGKRGQVVVAKLDPKTGKIDFWQVQTVVDDSMIYSEEELAELQARVPDGQEKRVILEEEETPSEEKKVRFNPERHVMVEDAKKLKKGAKPGETIETKLQTHADFGRIAAQTGKQVILQKIREAERDMILNEFKQKEGELVSGVVQRLEGSTVLIDLGKTLGALPREEQTPGEFYRPGQRLKFYVLQVQDSTRGPQIMLSRAYPKLISKLFELEVPEIQGGTVEIKAITREPGSRSKIAAFSLADGVDAVGSMVGQRGTRVTAVINELGGEKIDVIEYAEDPKNFIANALSPAKVVDVEVHEKNRAVALVEEDQLSLAIGREGQNVRLAAKLTGWKIDVRTPGGKDVSLEEPASTEATAPEEEVAEEKKEE